MVRRIRQLGSLVSALTLTVGAYGCDPAPGGVGAADSGGAVPMDGGPEETPTVCARPADGCPCDTDRAAECYPDAIANDDGSRTCFLGTRYCRDGVWSACESLQSWVQGGPGEEGRASAGLIGTSEECDSCDPACATTTDEPDCSDIEPNSGLTCCDPPGGIG